MDDPTAREVAARELAILAGARGGMSGRGEPLVGLEAVLADGLCDCGAELRGGHHVHCPAVSDVWESTRTNLAAAVGAHLAETLAGAREDGIRQAIEWLRADYEYGAGPDWRENGAEWIAERAAEARLGIEGEA